MKQRWTAETCSDIVVTMTVFEPPPSESCTTQPYAARHGTARHGSEGTEGMRCADMHALRGHACRNACQFRIAIRDWHACGRAQRRDHLTRSVTFARILRRAVVLVRREVDEGYLPPGPTLDRLPGHAEPMGRPLQTPRVRARRWITARSGLRVPAAHSPEAAAAAVCAAHNSVSHALVGWSGEAAKGWKRAEYAAETTLPTSVLDRTSSPRTST